MKQEKCQRCGYPLVPSSLGMSCENCHTHYVGKEPEKLKVKDKNKKVN